MLQKDIDSLTQIMETTENVSIMKKYRDMAIQIVLFSFVIVTVGAVALLAYKSRNSTHVQRMRSLIRCLAIFLQNWEYQRQETQNWIQKM